MIITFARGFGSGGKTIAKMLAEELGVNCYGRNIVRLASDESGISEDLFAQADEKRKYSLLKFAPSKHDKALSPPESNDFVSNDNLFKFQANVIKNLAQNESAVIIGRCADYVLKDYDNLISVFIHADLETSVNNVVDMYGVPEHEAKKLIEKNNKSRSEYYKYYTGQNWENAKNYDLCLDSSNLGYEKCVDIIKAYIKVRISG